MENAQYWAECWTEFDQVKGFERKVHWLLDKISYNHVVPVVINDFFSEYMAVEYIPEEDRAKVIAKLKSELKVRIAVDENGYNNSQTLGEKINIYKSALECMRALALGEQNIDDVILWADFKAHLSHWVQDVICDGGANGQ